MWMQKLSIVFKATGCQQTIKRLFLGLQKAEKKIILIFMNISKLH